MEVFSMRLSVSHGNQVGRSRPARKQVPVGTARAACRMSPPPSRTSSASVSRGKPPPAFPHEALCGSWPLGQLLQYANHLLRQVLTPQQQAFVACAPMPPGCSGPCQQKGLGNVVHWSCCALCLQHPRLGAFTGAARCSAGWLLHRVFFITVAPSGPPLPVALAKRHGWRASCTEKEITGTHIVQCRHLAGAGALRAARRARVRAVASPSNTRARRSKARPGGIVRPHHPARA